MLSSTHSFYPDNTESGADTAASTSSNTFH